MPRLPVMQFAFANSGLCFATAYGSLCWCNLHFVERSVGAGSDMVALKSHDQQRKPLFASFSKRENHSERLKTCSYFMTPTSASFYGELIADGTNISLP